MAKYNQGLANNSRMDFMTKKQYIIGAQFLPTYKYMNSKPLLTSGKKNETGLIESARTYIHCIVHYD